MSTIAVVGVTGSAGSHIAAEALRRGHEVIGVSRSAPPDPQPGLTVRSGNITDQALMRQLAEQASTLVIAVHGSAGNAPFLLPLVPSLLEISGASGTRIGFAGGAGSLLVTPDGPRLVDTPEFPAMFKVEAESHAEVLETLRASGSPADWFYVSPAAGFGAYAPGERTGTFRSGGDVLLTMPKGTRSSAEQTSPSPSSTRSISQPITANDSASPTEHGETARVLRESGPTCHRGRRGHLPARAARLPRHPGTVRPPGSIGTGISGCGGDLDSGSVSPLRPVRR